MSPGKKAALALAGLPCRGACVGLRQLGRTVRPPGHAVRPQFSDQGIGTALLRDRLAALDLQGLPTYLEASNRDSARLYERLGYKRLDRTTDMPGGPSLSHRPRAVVRTRRAGHRFRLHLGHTRPQISRQPLPGLTEIAQIPPTQPRSASLAGGLGAPVKAPGCRSRDHPRPALHRFSVTPRSTGARTTSVRSNDLDFGSNGIPAMGWRGSREAGWPARPSRRPSP